MIIQPFGPLDADTEAALRDSIGKFGVIEPVVVDQDGRILDGHHRAKIAADLKIDYPTVTRTVADDAEAAEIARDLNLKRRHLSAKERREVVAHLTAEGHSQRAIAKATKVSRAQVRADQIQVGTPAHLNVKPPKKVVGEDGKQYPAKRAEKAAETPSPAPDPPAAPVVPEPVGQPASAPVATEAPAERPKALWTDVLPADLAAKVVAIAGKNAAAEFCVKAIRKAVMAAESPPPKPAKEKAPCAHTGKRTTNGRCFDCWEPLGALAPPFQAPPSPAKKRGR